MWLTSFPLVSDCLLACLDLTISYSSTAKTNPPASIKLWNYNKSVEDRNKGVKEFVFFIIIYHFNKIGNMAR